MDAPTDETPITREEAIAIAEADAVAVYGDLSRFALEAHFKNERWCIRYRFVPLERYHTGGGPSYVLNAFDGTIIWKLYGQ